MKPGEVFGHEFMVQEGGHEVKKVKKGDRVVGGCFLSSRKAPSASVPQGQRLLLF
jgi:threonine dehydrogenase-like Zn-dependent dehydrogenase